jgi:nitroreductase
MSAAWQIDSAAFPSGSNEDKLHFLLQYAVLAPSAHNTQPWRWELDGASVVVYRDPEYTLKIGDPTMRETFLGLGAFVENLVTAAEGFGLTATVTELAETVADLKIARVTIKNLEAAKLVQPELLEAISNRHTNRGAYAPEPIADAILQELKVLIEQDAKIFLITDQQARTAIAELVGKGTKIALSMNGMKRELADLVTFESSEVETGMTVEAMSEVPPKTGDSKAWLLNDFDATKEAKIWQDHFTTSPLQVIIATEYDGPESWIVAGRLMERALLIGARHGLMHCISAAPVEIPVLAPLLRQQIDTSYRPQVLFRLGKPINKNFTRHSNRRPVGPVAS